MTLMIRDFSVVTYSLSDGTGQMLVGTKKQRSRPTKSGFRVWQERARFDQEFVVRRRR